MSRNELLNGCPVRRLWLCATLLGWIPLVDAQNATADLKFSTEAHEQLLTFGQKNLGSPFDPDREPTEKEYEDHQTALLSWIDGFTQKHPDSTNKLSAQLLKAKILKHNLAGCAAAEKVLAPLMDPDGPAARRWQWIYAHRIYASILDFRARMRQPVDEDGVRAVVEYLRKHANLFRRLDDETDPDFLIVYSWQASFELPWNKKAKRRVPSGEDLLGIGYLLQEQVERLDDRWCGVSSEAEGILQRVIREYPETDTVQQAAFHLQHINENMEFARQWEEWARKQGQDTGVLSPEERKRSRDEWREELRKSPETSAESAKQWEEWKRKQKVRR